MTQKGTQVRTLKSLYVGGMFILNHSHWLSQRKFSVTGAPQQQLNEVLTIVLGKILGRFYYAATLKPLKLLDFYDFNGLNQQELVTLFYYLIFLCLVYWFHTQNRCRMVVVNWWFR